MAGQAPESKRSATSIDARWCSEHVFRFLTLELCARRGDGSHHHQDAPVQIAHGIYSPQFFFPILHG